MAGWLCPQLGGRLPAINHVPHDAFFDQGHSLARHSLSVESRARLQRVIDVIENTDVLAEDLLAETPSQETPLIAQRGGAEISKQLSYQIQYCRRLQHDGVAARGDLSGCTRIRGFLRGNQSKIERRQLGGVARAFLRPTRTILRHSGDRELRHGFRVVDEPSVGIQKGQRGFARRVDAGGRLRRTFHRADSFSHSFRAAGWRHRGRLLEPARRLDNVGGCGQRQRFRIGRL